MPGGGTAAGGAGEGNASGMSDQEAAMVKAVSGYAGIKNL